MNLRLGKIVEVTGMAKRQKRRRIYEIIKTAAICLLCVSAVSMIFRLIGMQSSSDENESFWSSGGNTEQMASSELTSEGILRSYLDFSAPELIIVNKGENRGELKQSHEQYDSMLGFVNKVMQSVHNETAVYSKVSVDAVLKNLMLANSVYVKYPCARLTEADAQFFRIEGSAFAKNARSYSELFILPDTTSERVVVFVMSEENQDEMIRIQTESFAATLSELINSIESIDKREYAYAAELNLDKPELKDGESAPVSLNSMLEIPLENVISKTAVADIPREYADTLNFTQTTDFGAGLMDIFNYNINTIRQYADNNGTLTFVSEKGTISMNQDGVLEYKALDHSAGVTFVSGTNSGENDIYTITSGVIKTVSKVMNLCYKKLSHEDLDIRFTDVGKTAEGEMHFLLDYYVDGYRVKMKKGSAIDVKVNNGVMTELRMCLNTFELTDDNFENTSLVDAIDEFCAKSKNNKRVESAALVYEFNGVGNEMNTKWEIGD